MSSSSRICTGQCQRGSLRRTPALCRWQALAVGTVPLVTADDAFDQRLYADSGVGGATLGPSCSLPCYPRPCLQITHAVSPHVIRGQSCAPYCRRGTFRTRGTSRLKRYRACYETSRTLQRESPVSRGFRSAPPERHLFRLFRLCDS